MPLYPYQERVKELIKSGRSIILQAPTGAGKTRAALAPFIENFFETPIDSTPHKCVYVVPMRVLANQFSKEYKEYAKSYELKFGREVRVTIQTGEQSEDRRFDQGDLIFCTIDQFLSSYLTMPYSLPNRLANINAGAMAGAYLVFDEFHLLDPSSTLPSTLYAIKQLRQLAPVLLMTATFSESMLKQLAEELDAEVFLLPADEARQIETRNGNTTSRQRVWRITDTALSAEAVLSSHNTRSLALCNTVQRAQTLFRELRALIHERNLDIRLMLLHSRFLPEDRRETERELQRLFGKNADRSGSVIAVATQTVEVGVDITSEVLHTELAPASALIQRAGRCARYPGEQGQVVVYPVESYMPYGRTQNDSEKESLWVKEMRAAFAWLQTRSGEVFDFSQEQALVNAVATPRDEKILLELSAGSRMRAEAVQRVLNGDRADGDSRLLVRDADSRLVLVHPNPDELLANPHGTVGFNLQTSTLFGMLKGWLERDVDVEWRVKRLLEDKNPDRNEDNRTEYDWRSLEDTKLLTITRVLVVNPNLAGYLREEGFVADQGNTPFESSLPQNSAERTWDGFSYRLESYEDHIHLVLRAFEELTLNEVRFPAQALERAAGWPAGSVLKAAWLACLLHDVGKLSKGWQGWVRAYQKQIGNPVLAGFAAAHTDSDRNNPKHKEAERAIFGKHKKPHHAGEGALATAGILLKALDGNKLLVKATLTAVTRHHTPFAKECETYLLEPNAKDHIQATLGFVPADVQSVIDLSLLKGEVKSTPNSFSGLLIEPNDTYGWMAYTLLARTLRRADQEGTARGSREA